MPRYLVAEPSNLAAAQQERPYQQVAEGLEVSIRELHAAGVKAEVQFVPFVETQKQKVRVTLPWIVMDPEKGPAGSEDQMLTGGRYGESSLGGSRFE